MKLASFSYLKIYHVTNSILFILNFFCFNLFNGLIKMKRGMSFCQKIIFNVYLSLYKGAKHYIILIYIIGDKNN